MTAKPSVTDTTVLPGVGVVAEPVAVPAAGVAGLAGLAAAACTAGVPGVTAMADTPSASTMSDTSRMFRMFRVCFFIGLPPAVEFVDLRSEGVGSSDFAAQNIQTDRLIDCIIFKAKNLVLFVLFSVYLPLWKRCRRRRRAAPPLSLRGAKRRGNPYSIPRRARQTSPLGKMSPPATDEGRPFPKVRRFLDSLSLGMT